MIVFDLTCPDEHLFEAWFASSAAFEDQRDAGAVTCPVCGSHDVRKALMAPNIGASVGQEKRSKPEGPGKNRAVAKVSPQEKALREALVKLRETVERNCDYVGPAFPEEARKIFYGETEERNIYGEASPEEAERLAEEGIEVQAVPWLPREN